MAKVILAICGMVHASMKFLRISPAWLRDRCDKVCRRYEHRKTRRIAFLPDTSPYWNVVDTTKMYPLKKLPFDGYHAEFPCQY